MFFIERRQTRRFFFAQGRCILCAAGDCENRATELLTISLTSLLTGFVNAIACGGGPYFDVCIDCRLSLYPSGHFFVVSTGALVDAFVK